MRQAQHRLLIATEGKGLVEITEPIQKWLGAQAIATGLLTVFCRHTSASLVIQENADPDVRKDLEAFFERLVPEAAGSTSMRPKDRTTCRPISVRR
jgi:secondary thiamine-phosphate synthase enzyme